MSKPDYKRWIIILLIMSQVGTLLALFLGKVTSYDQALLYGMLPAILLWLLFFGLAFSRYEHSVNAALLWNEETEITKRHWQRWSRKQQIVVSNVVLSPEENGIGALLGNLADIPAYPAKARPLFIDLPGLINRLEFIDQETEKQCPGYRHYLSEIFIQFSGKYQKEMIGQEVYKQWDLYPKYSDKVELFCANDENELSGLVLLIFLQGWDSRHTEKYSEFITAQLIASDHFVSQYTLPIISAVGRCLSSDSLFGALDMLSEYNRLKSESIRYVWVSGMDDEREKLVKHLLEKSWALPDKRPLISLDHSFGPPGPLMFPLSVSLLVDAAKNTGEVQLLILRNEESRYLLCLIVRELFL
ncbi:hypothetical protein [Erwinia typographi]|nr:hypothetical protein [Erwinia typographi]